MKLHDFLTKVGAFLQQNRVPFIAAAALLGVLVICIVAAALAGAFDKTADSVPATSTLPPTTSSLPSSFVLESITDDEGAADANVNILGSFEQMDTADYMGPFVSGQEVVAVWKHVGRDMYLVYAKVTATGLYVKYLAAVALILFSTGAAIFAPNAPLDNTGTWSRVLATPASALGPRQVVFSPSS